MSPLPGDLVGPQQSLYVVAKSFRHPEHGSEVLASWSSGLITLMSRPSNLIQVPANRPELGRRTLQCQELFPSEAGSDGVGATGEGRKHRWRTAYRGPSPGRLMDSILRR
jgi:hypothetical protein